MTWLRSFCAEELSDHLAKVFVLRIFGRTRSSELLFRAVNDALYDETICGDERIIPAQWERFALLSGPMRLITFHIFTVLLQKITSQLHLDNINIYLFAYMHFLRPEELY